MFCVWLLFSILVSRFIHILAYIIISFFFNAEYWFCFQLKKLQLIYNVLISAVQQSDSVIYIYLYMYLPFLKYSFPLQFIIEYRIQFSVLYIQQDVVVYPFCIVKLTSANPSLPAHHASSSFVLLGNHKSVLCESVSVSCVCVCMLVVQSCLTLCSLMDCSPARLLCLQNSPGKNSEVSCHALLQGIFLTQGLNLGLPHCRQFLYLLSHQGSPGQVHLCHILDSTCK